MIFLLADDPKLREFISYALNREDFAVTAFADRESLLQRLAQRLPSALIMDISTFRDDGLAMLRRLRGGSLTKALPIIVLSNTDGEFDKVLALDSGADDYLVKPFSMLELLARTRALLRRSELVKLCDRYIVGDLAVNIKKHAVHIGERSVSLTVKEFSLLVALLENRGTVLSRDQLQNKIWGYEINGGSRTVDVHIRTLRKKIAPADAYIETIRGVGYRFIE